MRRSDLDGSNAEIIGSFNSRHFDIYNDKIYFSKSNAYVYSMNLDGSNEVTLGNSFLSSLYDVKVDKIQQRVYFASEASNKIGYMPIGGGSKTDVFNTNGARNFALTPFHTVDLSSSSSSSKSSSSSSSSTEILTSSSSSDSSSSCGEDAFMLMTIVGGSWNGFSEGTHKLCPNNYQFVNDTINNNYTEKWTYTFANNDKIKMTANYTQLDTFGQTSIIVDTYNTIKTGNTPDYNGFIHNRWFKTYTFGSVQVTLQRGYDWGGGKFGLLI